MHESGWVIDNIQKNKNKRNNKLGNSIHSLPPQEIIFPFSLKIKTVNRKKIDQQAKDTNQKQTEKKGKSP